MEETSPTQLLRSRRGSHGVDPISNKGRAGEGLVHQTNPSLIHLAIVVIDESFHENLADRLSDAAMDLRPSPPFSLTPGRGHRLPAPAIDADGARLRRNLDLADMDPFGKVAGPRNRGWATRREPGGSAWSCARPARSASQPDAISPSERLRSVAATRKVPRSYSMSGERLQQMSRHAAEGDLVQPLERWPVNRPVRAGRQATHWACHLSPASRCRPAGGRGIRSAGVQGLRGNERECAFGGPGAGDAALGGVRGAGPIPFRRRRARWPFVQQRSHRSRADETRCRSRGLSLLRHSRAFDPRHPPNRMRYECGPLPKTTGKSPPSKVAARAACRREDG